MKKSLIFKILYLFLVLIVVAGASVFATNAYLSARDVNYGSSNVEDALNGLFTLKENTYNYSTDEQVVGKWIDGKNIYRIVIPLNTLPNCPQYTWTDIATFDITNIDELVNTRLLQTTFNETVQNLSYIGICYRKNTHKIQAMNCREATFSSASPVRIILEYTKTID